MKVPRLTAILTVSALVLAGCSDADEGADALAVQTEEGQIDGFVSFENGSDKSFGLFACSNADQVTLESVEAVATEGEVAFLGAMVYQATDGFIGAVDGFPPTGLADDSLSDLEGFVLDLSCELQDPETKTQVVLGVDRTGPTGGKVEGIKVTHSEGELEISDYQIILCGDDYEYCENLREDS